MTTITAPRTITSNIAAPRTVAEARPDLAAAQPTERRVPEGTEVRGFALYVGLADGSAQSLILMPTGLVDCCW